MSHELRTPLNIVIGLSDMLINERALNLDAARRNDYAQLIHASSHHLLSLIDGIMDMARLDAGVVALRRELFAPGPVIAHCAELLAPKAKQAGLELRVELAADLPEILADQCALKQILINLLSNAIKFTECGQVTLRGSVERGELVICVEDSGIGIAADDLPRVGSPFFRGGTAKPRQSEGHGLGLSIVKSLVGRHDGRLEIQSRSGEGTCAVVRIPIGAQAEPPASTPGSAPRWPHVDRAGEAPHCTDGL
jgi:cell cycle sensor histidine kinase DivJ